MCRSCRKIRCAVKTSSSAGSLRVSVPRSACQKVLMSVVAQSSLRRAVASGSLKLMLEGSSVFYCKTFPGCCEVVEACWHHRSGVFLRTVEKSGVWLITLLMTMLSFKELVMLLSCIMRHFISFSCFHSLPCFFSHLGSCPVFLFCFCFPALCSPDLLMVCFSLAWPVSAIPHCSSSPHSLSFTWTVLLGLSSLH